MADNKFTIDKLCKINGNGFTHAQLPEIIDALVKGYRAIYGNDIDVSSASADGQYIINEAYIYKNIFDVLDNITQNLNPNTASGSALDVLASLSNIKRRNSSKSKVSLYVQLTNNNTQVNFDSPIQAMDSFGNVWTAVPNTTNNNFYQKFDGTSGGNNSTLVLDFECEDYGAHTAIGAHKTITDIKYVFDTTKSIYYNGAGKVSTSIGSFISLDSRYLVYQNVDAVVGNLKETDEELRTRMASERGLGALTTLDSLEAALYDLEYIKDVKVFNNPTGSTLKDNTPNTGGSVYIAIRYVDNIVPENYTNQIGKIIWNYMTPGVKTIAPVNGTTLYGNNMEYVIDGLKGQMKFNWKKCSPRTVTGSLATITCTVNSLTNGLSDENKESISKSITNYIENVSINEDLSQAKLMQAVLLGDLKENGNNVLLPTACTINCNPNKIAYFKVTSIAYTGTSPTITITIS